MKKTVLFLLTLALLSACSDKGVGYSVEGKIDAPGMNGKQVVFIEISDGNMLASDTIMIVDNAFTYDGKVNKICVRTGNILDSDIPAFEIVLGEGPVKVKVRKDKKVEIGGTPYNDALQKIYEKSTEYGDNMRANKAAMDKDIAEGKLTKEKEEEYASTFRKLIDENTTTQIAFARENIENPLGEYYFFRTYFFQSFENKQEMMLFATPAIKEKFNL